MFTFFKVSANVFDGVYIRLLFGLFIIVLGVGFNCGAVPTAEREAGKREDNLSTFAQQVFIREN